MDRSIKKVIVLGSGRLSDYCIVPKQLKALSEEGVYTILINPNIANSSEGGLFFLPVTPYFVEKVIQKECSRWNIAGSLEVRLLLIQE